MKLFVSFSYMCIKHGQNINQASVARYISPSFGNGFFDELEPYGNKELQDLEWKIGEDTHRKLGLTPEYKIQICIINWKVVKV